MLKIIVNPSLISKHRKNFGIEPNHMHMYITRMCHFDFDILEPNLNNLEPHS